MLAKFVRRVMYWLFDTVIAAKWLSDRRSLPLCPQHLPLYQTIHRCYFKVFRRFPDLKSCPSYNDKIQWLKLFDQDRKIIRCTDKLTARDYVRERVGDANLIELLQVADSFDEIDFDRLPRSFVIKATHDCGSVSLIHDKETFDRTAVRSKINAALASIYGQNWGEWQYAFIKPRIIVERFLDPTSKTPPPDYKFHCVDGKVKFVHYIYDRGFETKEQVIDSDAAPIPIQFAPDFKVGTAFQKPAEWNEMRSLAEGIATGFKYARVDLYLVDGKIYFGEISFSPHAGFCQGPGQIHYGRYLDFDRSTTKPPVFYRPLSVANSQAIDAVGA
jgi:hypothetical protein